MGSKNKSCISSSLTNEVPESHLLIFPNETVFISGPMSGFDNFNREAFARMEHILNKHFGCRVLNPGRRGDGHEYEWYMDRCAEDIAECTTVVFIPGWQSSPGAKREFSLAHRLHKGLLFAEQIEIIINHKGEQ